MRLPENQMGYLSDLQTLEWFWNKIREDEIVFRTEKISPAWNFQTTPTADSTKEARTWFAGLRPSKKLWTK